MLINTCKEIIENIGQSGFIINIHFVNCKFTWKICQCYFLFSKYIFHSFQFFNFEKVFVIGFKKYIKEIFVCTVWFSRVLIMLLHSIWLSSCLNISIYSPRRCALSSGLHFSYVLSTKWKLENDLKYQFLLFQNSFQCHLL